MIAAGNQSFLLHFMYLHYHKTIIYNALREREY